MIEKRKETEEKEILYRKTAAAVAVAVAVAVGVEGEIPAPHIYSRTSDTSCQVTLAPAGIDPGDSLHQGSGRQGKRVSQGEKKKRLKKAHSTYD
ncbi:hypothetical protein E2C01_091795 [Portunus trituberculatus]|uniref:Uncharacterized protein n=1 Tax=Portunus trituberculatus TaxID=210409 RepID=A0A5B7JJZ1_PORTR|nr:hypothetical protein [Portunus trituberculatus]